MTTDPVDAAHIGITTPVGIPGFTDLRHWQLEAIPDGVFSHLRSLDRDGVGLIVAEPWDLVPGYEPDLPDGDLAELAVTAPEQVLVLVVVSIDASAGRAWVNLAAPIVVNTDSCAARQVVLDRQGWPVRHELILREA